MEQTDKQYTDNMIHTDTKAQATKAKKKTGKWDHKLYI